MLDPPDSFDIRSHRCEKTIASGPLPPEQMNPRWLVFVPARVSQLRAHGQRISFG
jgi:hypothetical protein